LRDLLRSADVDDRVSLVGKRPNKYPRDVFESLYTPINVLFIDEMIDNGLDTQGVESALALLKQMSRERHKSIWLVSHRDELAGRVENILKVVKEGGFTSYNTDIEIA
jgi:DNA repair exonuclease SbcCD ATPase subunit